MGSVQRKHRKRSPQSGRHRLDCLGFVWNPYGDQWETGFQHLEAFVREHGHCRVHHHHEGSDGYRLGVWVSNQRSNKDSMRAERKARLDALGFVWSVKDDAGMPERVIL
jgi:helicase associated protein